MRQTFIADLARQLGVVTSRRVSVTLGLWGEPGIGKTHAARDILEHVPCHHLSVHATTPLSHIESAFPEAKALPDWVKSQLGRLRRCEPMEPQAVAQVFAASLSALAPFVLHLEDIHEADAERVELIELFAQAVARTRGVGLLVTSRAEPPTPFRSHHLEPITKVETALLLEHELKASVPSDSLEWIFGRTLGNPLFTLEFVRYLRRQGFLWSDGEAWHWRVPPEDFVPISVEALIAQLSSGLTENAEAFAVLEARALLPSGANTGDWMFTAGIEHGEFDRAKNLLVAASLIKEDGFSFAHPLIGEVIARDVPQVQRRIYASRALASLERRDPVLAVKLIDAAELTDSEVLELFNRATERSRNEASTLVTARLLSLAAEHSFGEDRLRFALEAETLFRANGALNQCVRMMRLALQDHPDHREARYRLAMAWALMGNEAEVRSLVAELPLVEREEARWVAVIFRAQTYSTRTSEALEMWRAHPELEQNPMDVTYATNMYINFGDLGAAEHLIERAFARPDFPAARRITLTGFRAVILSERGRFEEAQELQDQKLRSAREGGNTANIAAALYNGSFNLYRLGRYEDTIRALEESVEKADSVGILQYAANARTLLGATLASLGRFERAETTMLEGFAVLRLLDVTHSLANAEWELALLYSEWRPPHGADLALKFARDAVRHARQLQNPRCLLGALPAAARVEAWTGDPAVALALAEEARRLESSSFEDVDACNFAFSIALEVNGQVAHALQEWERTINAAKTPEFTFEAELERARLMENHGRIRELLTWFESRGLGRAAQRARRALPMEEPDLEATQTVSTRLSVLGLGTLEHNAQPVPTRAKKRLEFLAYLLETRIAGRSEASTLELVDALYPFTPEPEAKKSLKQLVYLNRTALGPESIVSTPTGYALGAVSSDAEDFLESGHPALWRGAYLSGLSEGWHPGVRDALTLALRAKAEALLEVNPGEAARLGALLVEMEPYDLEALRLTVSGFERAGKRGAARSAYREGYQRLADIGEVLPETLEELLEMRVRSN